MIKIKTKYDAVLPEIAYFGIILWDRQPGVGNAEALICAHGPILDLTLADHAKAEVEAIRARMIRDDVVTNSDEPLRHEFIVRIMKGVRIGTWEDVLLAAYLLREVANPRCVSLVASCYPATPASISIERRDMTAKMGDVKAFGCTGFMSQWPTKQKSRNNVTSMFKARMPRRIVEAG